MRPPILARALVAAAAPASDYEIIAGDLHEEYLRIVHARGTTTANRWYWGQALLSIPSLLSYSRSNASALRQIGIAFTAFAVLVAMLVVLMVIDTIFGNARLPDWVWVCINYTDAVVFGAILALLVRSDVLRVAFYASLFLVLCFVIPAVAGHPGSQAPLAAWIYLLGAIPAMCLGAGAYQAIRARDR
jgi:hypothetical protein